LQWRNIVSAPSLFKKSEVSYISFSLDIPVEQISGLFKLLAASSNSWFVKSADAILNADNP